MSIRLKRILMSVLVMGALFFTGCDSLLQSADKTNFEEKNNNRISDKADNANIASEELEITFLNYHPGMGRDAVGLTNNQIYSAYIPDGDPETLYAFMVEFDHYNDGKSYFPEDYPNLGATDYTLERCIYDTAKAVELMKKAGLTVLKDYPYCFYNNDELLSFDSMDIDKLTLGLCTVVGTMDEIKRVFDETEPMEGWYCYVWSAPRPDMVEKIKESGWTGTADLLSSYAGPTEFYKSILGEENQVKMRVEIKE